jgi:hypothetical protein
MGSHGTCWTVRYGSARYSLPAIGNSNFNTLMYGLRDGTARKDGLARFRPGELAEKGHDALKAQTLAAGLGVTRGSFYWHFEDLEAFKRDLIAHWTDLTSGNSCAPWCAKGRRRRS